MDIGKLRTIMYRRKVSVKQLAGALGMNESTFYRKIKQKGETFTLDEIKKTIIFLNLDECEKDEIFFGKNSRICEKTEK